MARRPCSPRTGELGAAAARRRAPLSLRRELRRPSSPSLPPSVPAAFLPPLSLRRELRRPSSPSLPPSVPAAFLPLPSSLRSPSAASCGGPCGPWRAKAKARAHRRGRRGGGHGSVELPPRIRAPPTLPSISSRRAVGLAGNAPHRRPLLPGSLPWVGAELAAPSPARGASSALQRPAGTVKRVESAIQSPLRRASELPTQWVSVEVALASVYKLK
ncbi:verprolin-like [Panicum virgatum]|uniref:verprolin-like n=1 Tax=Panicum virgatum TaxID=38727 RepID=UPI0019D65D01|nr:verprolin-like [Panicum virgatum]